MHITSVQDLGRLRGLVINAYDVAGSQRSRSTNRQINDALGHVLVDLDRAVERLEKLLEAVNTVNNAQA